MLASAPRAHVHIVLIAAIAENDVIGRDNALPWRLRSDMRHFRAITMGKPVVMGRKTYVSIGKPLAGRTTIVVTRDPALTIPGVIVATSVATALGVARGDALRRGASEIAVIGGAELFAQTLPLADRLEITRVHANIEGDVRFPPIDRKRWQEAARCEQVADTGDDADMVFITYEPAADAGGERHAL